MVDFYTSRTIPMETGKKYSIGELQNLQLYHNLPVPVQ